MTNPPVRFGLDRAAAIMAAGVVVLVTAALAAAAFTLSSLPLGLVVIAALVGAAVFALRPPAVLKLDPEGYQSRLRLSSGPFAGKWQDVEDASVENGNLILTTTEGTQAFPLRLVGGQRIKVLKAVSEHLDAAHGYRRWFG